MAMLEVKNLEVYYGVICALKGISFEVNEGEIVSLIGANGAGKTTMMQSVVGLIPKKSGIVTFNGKDITKTPCHNIVQLVMTQVPEGRRIFQELSVYENLMMGAYTVRDQQQFKTDLEKMFDKFPRLKERRHQVAGTLSGGELQRVLLALALEPLPNILILDEPLSGVDVEGMQSLMDMLDEIRKTYDLSILMTTHDFSMLPRYADQVVLINHGTAAKGTPEEVLNSEVFHQIFHLRGGSV